MVQCNLETIKWYNHASVLNRLGQTSCVSKAAQSLGWEGIYCFRACPKL